MFGLVAAPPEDGAVTQRRGREKCVKMRKEGSIGAKARVEADLKELEAALGHRFSRPELLVCALTHRSLAHELAQRAGPESEERGRGQTGRERRPGQADNERLEFLGDAVLGLVVAEALFIAHPEWREGEFTRVRSGLVSRQHMAQVAERSAWGSICA